MPTLNWIGKDAVVNHDKEVPFKLLKKVKANSFGGDSQNLIIKGDNLEGLKALMPYYIGKIKCIYIDPPYNTGNENWVYNDKVNSPKIKKWLGKVVGGESQDLCRHDKWLCMMYPRLKLLKDLLSEDGIIFVSIDDNEQAHLKLLFDEIFGEENLISQLVWKKKAGGGSDTKYFASDHEYILVYAKDEKVQERYFVDLNDKLKGDYKYKDSNFERFGLYKRKNLYQTGIETDRPNLNYQIECPDKTKISPPTIWRWSKETFLKAKEEGRIDFVKNKAGKWQVFTKMYLYDDLGEEYKTKPRSLLLEMGLTKEGNDDLKKVFDKNKPFDYPKPVKLIKYLIKIISDKDSIILDSFAGSGTTGHAVLDLNKEDGGNRKFILIEMEDDIARKITAERIKRAIEKYDYKDGFEYCELDKPLFNEDGQIEESCDFNQFANYIYFTETQTNIDKKEVSGNFIGEHNEVEYYLIYKEKLKNVLSKSFLKKIKKNDNKKVIYADKCLIDEDILNKYNIQFKQIPYEVKVY